MAKEIVEANGFSKVITVETNPKHSQLTELEKLVFFLLFFKFKNLKIHKIKHSKFFIPSIETHFKNYAL